MLVLEDDPDAREAVVELLRAQGRAVRGVGSVAAALALIEGGEVEPLALLDLGLPDGDGLEVLRALTALPDQRSPIVLTGQRRLERVVEAMRLGAVDYLTKPLNPKALQIALERAERLLDDREDARRLRAELARRGSFEGMVGRSPALLEVTRIAERVAPSQIPVMIVGESGTGKELLAKAIHTIGPRRREPFVAINCGAIPANLVESELFGHERGAFTGATQRRIGVFEQADRGTLFLDEVGEMPLEAQVKLLRALETREIRRVGGSESIAVEPRIISATNREPQVAVDEGRLRADLFFRLNVFPIRLPPLRERREDIPLLAAHFAAELGGGEHRLSPAAEELLAAQAWEGNVRELRNVLSRALLLCDGDTIEPSHLVGPGIEGGRGAPKALADREAPGGEDGVLIPAGATLEEAEFRLISAYLERFDGHRAATARALGISPRTLYNKCKAWGLKPGTPGRRGEG